MSRKDYEMLASTINNELASAKGKAREALSALAKNLCVKLSLDNPRFSPERFLSACGL